MAQIPGREFAEPLFRGSSRFLPRLGFTGGAILVLLATSWMQAQTARASDSIPKPTTSAVNPVTPQEVPPPPPPPPVEQKPPQPPVVTWDGKQLTIDAANSTLSAILVAVRERTSASIEIPAAAAAERVFVHLGPGSARDIISSLLYGTMFDYVIQASDDDPDSLRSVVLMARDRIETPAEGVIAEATNLDGERRPGSSTLAGDGHRGGATDGFARPEGMRMMPGWAAPGKPSFQAEAEAALAAKEAAAQDSAAPAQESTAAVQESAAPPDVAEGTRASNSSPSTPSTSDTNDSSPVGQAIHNMTRMFEQRRQIQAQQNQPPPPSSN